MAKLFGTDGIRGIYNENLTDKLAKKVGLSLGYILKKNNTKGKVIIGCDTRESSESLVDSISKGLSDLGIDVINLGVIPTPAVSYLIDYYNASSGVVVSASHNPYNHNGIKIFNSEGYKLSDDLEEEIENIILNEKEIEPVFKKGNIIYDADAYKYYVDHLVSSVDISLKNIKVAVDCANGAAYKTAELLFEKLGCDYVLLNNKPDGKNINQNCGSTHPEVISSYVVSHNLDCGICYDGDADRCIMIDENGEIVDGDYILSICSSIMKKEGKLKNSTVVGTVMSNLGFVKYCEESQIKFIATKVGDRHVLECMLENGYNLGGEQSGHIIFTDYAKTGDGELTSIIVLEAMVKENASLSKLSLLMTKYPQVLINVNVSNSLKDKINTDEEILDAIKNTEAILKDTGRVLVRPSGTESLIRVMIEGKDEEHIKELANSLALLISKKLN